MWLLMARLTDAEFTISPKGDWTSVCLSTATTWQLKSGYTRKAGLLCSAQPKLSIPFCNLRIPLGPGSQPQPAPLPCQPEG